MTYFRRIAVIVLVVLLSSALASSFSALTVTSFGDQNYDVATGVTTLSSGGEIIDRETNMVLLGTHLSYQEGNYVEAQGASVSADFGRLSAAYVRYDVASQRLFASGGVVLRTSANIALDTFELSIDLSNNITIAKTNVSLKEPAIQAAGMVFFGRSAEIGFLGPYVYQNGSTTLQGTSAADVLRLTWAVSSDSVVFSTPVEASDDFASRTLAYF